MIMRPFEFPTGQRAFQKTYQPLQNSHTGLRPYISESAATTKGPRPKPSMYMENEICVVLMSMPRSAEIWGRAEAVMLALIRVTSCPADTTETMEIFRSGVQLTGLRGSSSRFHLI